MSFIESLSELLGKKITKEDIQLSAIKENDYSIATLYLLSSILNVKELEEFANLLINMKTAKRTRNDLLKIARAIRIHISAGETKTVREVYVPKREEEKEEEEVW